MKKIIYIYFFITVIASIFDLKAETDSTFIYPTYQLRVTNYTSTPNTFEFDIYLKHTNPNETRFELAGHQYFFEINPALLPGGTTFTYKYVINQNGDTLSDLPFAFRPRNPSTAGNLLRLATNSLPGAGNGYIVDTAGLGVRVLRMRVGLSDTTQSFNTASYHFFMRDTITAGSFYTRINAYTGLNGTTNTTISYRMYNIVDSSDISPITTLNLKIAPEGLYNSSTDKLFRKDTVTMYLRNINSPYQIIDSSKAVIDSVNFSANFNFLVVNTGNYYFSVKTKNTLETWCKSGGISLDTGVNYYDMTTSASQAYGNNMVLKGSRYCVYSGNLNNDLIIDTDDLVLVDNDIYNYVGGAASTNLNGDGIVDIDDMAIIDINAANLILVEWPGLSPEMRRNLKSKNKNTLTYFK